MAKVHSSTDFALRIEFPGEARRGHFYLSTPKTPADWEARKRHHREEFEKLINRHIAPHFEGQFDVQTETQRVYTCEHCGAPWTEKSDTYNGGCCSKDEAANPEPQAA